VLRELEIFRKALIHFGPCVFEMAWSSAKMMVASKSGCCSIAVVADEAGPSLVDEYVEDWLTELVRGSAAAPRRASVRTNRLLRMGSVATPSGSREAEAIVRGKEVHHVGAHVERAPRAPVCRRPDLELDNYETGIPDQCVNRAAQSFCLIFALVLGAPGRWPVLSSPMVRAPRRPRSRSAPHDPATVRGPGRGRVRRGACRSRPRRAGE
jgi:hypothetical protein